ncbi:hypothetical protein ACTFIY_008531 [Dictyostelium cf. discoideum]
MKILLTIYFLIILIINYVNGLSIEHDLILKQQQQQLSDRHKHCKIGKYDFGGFKKEKGSYEFKSKKLNELGEEIEVEYYFNICSGSSKCDNSLISVCSRDSQFNDIIYGETLNSTLTIKQLKENRIQGGILTYSAPSNKCGDGIMKTTISMYCAKSQPNTIISVVNSGSPNNNNCNLEIAMLGDSACESNVDTTLIYLYVVSALLVLLILTFITCTILYYIDKKKKLSMAYSKLVNTTPGNDS